MDVIPSISTTLVHSNRTSIQHITTPIILLLGFLFCSPAVARGQHYPLRHFGTESGLPKSMVAGIYQDEDGYLYVGTSGGVCRFDGMTFTPLDPGSSVDYFYAKSFLLDREGDCWLGMEGNGLVRIHDGQVDHFGPPEGLPDNSVFALLEDRVGNLWVGTSSGLCRLRPQDRERGMERFQLSTEPGLAGTGIYRVVDDSEGGLWISSEDGLFLVRDDRVIRHWPHAIRGRGLARHPDGFIVVSMPGGLFRSDGDSLAPLYPDPRIEEFRLSDFAFSDGAVWIATYGQGLLRLKDNEFAVLAEKNGLATEHLYSLFVDREGSLWIGSIHGLSQLYEHAVVNYTRDDGLVANSVHSLEEDEMGNIYLGGDDGLSVVTREGILTLMESADGLPVRRIVSMKRADRGGGVIAWTEEGAKFRFFVRGGRATGALIHRPENGTSGMYAELTDRFGNQWASAPDSGIYCRSPNGDRLRWTTENGLPTNSFFEAGEDAAGAVWFSTIGQGVVRFRDGRFEQFTTADGLPSDLVEDIYVHPATGDLWFTTNRGPARWRGDDARPRFETFSDVAKLSVRDFGGITADGAGNLWFTTSAGVVCFDGETFELFTREHGLAGTECIGILTDAAGRVWVGGSRGASMIIPEALLHRVEPPGVFLKYVEARGEPISGGGDIRLSHRRNDLRFVFEGLSLRYPKGILYSYRLEPLVDEWSPFTSQSEVRFPSLPSGRYRFSARAMNIRGAVSGKPAEFSFTILPPVWQRWWFVLAAALLLFLAGRALYRWRIDQLLAVERMRSRIAADLHDDIASSLASIALYTEVIQRQLQTASGDVRNLLGRIGDLSREVMDNIGTIVWAVDPRHDELSEVLAYFQRQAGQLCNSAGIRFNSRCPDGLRSHLLTPEQRRTIYLVLKEGLSNILRHSRCSEVEFACTLQDRILDLTLRDNGAGFDESEVRGGHGLSNMRHRAREIGAEVIIESGVGEGTTLRFRVRIA